jgi:hypothetical protein
VAHLEQNGNSGNKAAEAPNRQTLEYCGLMKSRIDGYDAAALSAGIASRRKRASTSSTDNRLLPPNHHIISPKRPPATNCISTIGT